MATINLPEYETRIRDFCVSALETFSRENPATRVSTVVLYAFPNYGTLIFCLDTAANAAKHADEGGRDENGLVLISVPYFAFFEWRRLDIEEWSDAYEVDQEEEPLVIQTVDGGTVTMGEGEDDGDETLNEPVFGLLVKVMRDVTRQAAIRTLNREMVLGIGVEIEDSEFSEYWTFTGEPT